MKINNCHDIKIVHQYSVDILILIKISLHEKVWRAGMELTYRPCQLHASSSYLFV